MASASCSWTRRSTSVVLPVPDGAETMKSSPQALLDILDLLAQLLELRLRRDDQFRHADPVRLGPDGVDLAVHLLQKKIQLPPARLRAVAERIPVHQVGPEPGDLFADVGAGGGAYDLCGQRSAIDRHVGRELEDTLVKPLLEGDAALRRSVCQAFDQTVE